VTRGRAAPTASGGVSSLNAVISCLVVLIVVLWAAGL